MKAVIQNSMCDRLCDIGLMTVIFEATKEAVNRNDQQTLESLSKNGVANHAYAKPMKCIAIDNECGERFVGWFWHGTVTIPSGTFGIPDLEFDEEDFADIVSYNDENISLLAI